MIRTNLSLAGAVLGLSIFLNSAVEAKEPAQIYMLGDSSADTGTDGNRYSNLGSMWIESVAAKLGFTISSARLITPALDGTIDLSTAPIVQNGGNNYAVGGATAVPYPGNVSFADEMVFFKQDHAAIDKDDLIFVWMGSNDPFESVVRGLPYDPALYASTYMQNIDDLQALGARNIVAMGEPENLLPEQLYLDLGYPQILIDNHKINIHNSNQALWPLLQQSGVYVVDNNKLGNDILKDISAYGFTVGSEGYMTAGDPRALPDDGHIFADNHYAVGMHGVIADYALAQLRARDQSIRMLTQSMASVQQETDALQAHLDGQAFAQTNENGEQVQRTVGDVNVYSQGQYAKTRDKAVSVTDEDVQTDTGHGAVGGDVMISDNLLVGARVFYGKNHGDFADHTGTIGQTNVGASLYSVQKWGENGYTHLSATYSVINDAELKRTTKLGSVKDAVAKGETSGSAYAVQVGGGYDLELGALTITPHSALTYEKVNLSGYNEKDSVLSLSYGDSSHDALRTSVGIKTAWTPEDSAWRPYGAVGVDYDLKDTPLKTSIGPNEQMRVDYAVDRPARFNGQARLGAAYLIGVETALDIGVTARKSFDGKSEDLAGSIGLSTRF